MAAATVEDAVATKDKKLISGGTSNVLEDFLKALAAPPQSEVTTGAGGPALDALITQLRGLSTPTGASEQIKQIYNTGMTANAPGITNAMNLGGARSGTSSYNALATNDLTSKLAGQASLALNANAKAAADAATQLSQTNRTKVNQSTTGNLLQNILAATAAKGAVNLIQPALDAASRKAAALAKGSLASLMGTAPVTYTAGQAIEAGSGAPVSSFVSDIMSPGASAINPGFSAVDYQGLIAGAGTAAPKTTGAFSLDVSSPGNAVYGDVATPAGVGGGAEGAYTINASGDVVYDAGASGTAASESTASLGGNAGSAMAADLALTEITKGKVTKGDIGGSAVNAALWANPYVGAGVMTAELLGNTPVIEAVGGTGNFVAGAPGEMLGGIGDAAQGAWDRISSFFGF